MTWCRSFSTLDEAIEFVDGNTNAALFAVSEPVQGTAVKEKLASVMFGEWIIETNQEELTMAKVKEVQKGKRGKNVVEDLLGDDKPKRAKKVDKPVKGKAASVGRAAAFSDDQTIKVLKKHPGGREGSNKTITVGLLQSGITVGALQKLRKKKGIENPGTGVLRQLVDGGFIRIK